MVGEPMQLDDKTRNRIDLSEPVQEPVVHESRTGVTVTDLIHAASHGFAMIVRYVLLAGVDPNEKDANGRTALAVASSREIRDLLLEAGAGPLTQRR